MSSDWKEQAKEKLAAGLNEQSSKFTNGTTIEIPANPWPYSVEFSADNRNRMQGLERWQWLCENIGNFRQEWNISPAYSQGENIVYMFQHQEDAARFTLTWL